MSEMIERVTRCIRQSLVEGGSYKDAARAVFEKMRSPTAEMLAATLPFVDAPTFEQQTLAKAGLNLLPTVRIEQRFKGEIAAAELVRDWQTMIDSALTAPEPGK